ncbi:TonB-dependent siderophore receptor [Tolypothrix campylonemoides VB511288]|nr:TonB-dependent siderophore receptor [Tolypothrix campylonemoides VB511288]
MTPRPLALALACALAAPLPSFAQEPVRDPTTLDEIEVVGTRERGYRPTTATTANKTDAAIKETPFSIQVVSRELIEDRGVTTFGEAVRTVPGLTPQVGFNATNDRFRLRGFATPSNLKNGLRRSVFIPIDELANVEQIEVLKGPASALYGRFEPGGVVNIVTKKPLATQRTQIEATVGRYDFLRTTLDTGGPLSDTLGYRLTAAYQDNESFRDLVDARTQFISPVVEWRPGNATRVVAEFEYLHREQALDRGFGNNRRFLEVPISNNYGEPYARGTTISRLASVTLDHALGDDWDLRLAAQGSDGELNGLYVAYGFPAVSGAATPNPRVNRTAQPVFDRERDGLLQAELTGRFEALGARHRVLLGIEAGRTEEDSAFRSASLGPVDLFDPVYGQQPGPVFDAFFNSVNRTTALYVQDEIRLGERWIALVGARYDRAEYEAEDSFLLGGASGRGDVNAISPRAGLTWTPVDAVSLYASWAESFVPDPFARLADGTIPDPSEGEQREVGAKFSLLDGRLTPTIAWFDIRRRNGTIPDPNDPTFTFIIRAGEQRGRGWEFDVPFAVSERWRILAGYTRLEATFTEDPSLRGNRLANAPRDNGSLWSTYDLGGRLQGLSIGVGAHYVGEREANNANTFQLPSYTRYDANLAYRFGDDARWKAQLNVQNLTDERYYDSGGSFVPTYPGAPRTWTATLGVRF